MSSSRGRKASAKKKSAAAAAAPAVPVFTAETLEEVSDEIEMALEQGDLAQAEQIIRAPQLMGQLQPNQVTVQHTPLVPIMELYAQVLMQSDRLEEAVQWLLIACQLQPNEGHEKCMSVGQLLGGQPAVDAYKQGVSIMLKTRQALIEQQQYAIQHQNDFKMTNEDTPAVLDLRLRDMNKQISSGYTAIAELYVTDLCDEPQAESECEKLLTLALQSCPDSPDALYHLANLRKLRDRIPESVELMTKLMQVLEQCRANSIEQMSVLALADDQQNHAIPEMISIADVSYDLRVSIAKLAYELQLYEPAFNLLEELYEEDDCVLEVAHLAAASAYHANQPHVAMEYIERVEALLSTEQPTKSNAFPSSATSSSSSGEIEEKEESEETLAQKAAAENQLLAQMTPDQQQAYILHKTKLAIKSLKKKVQIAVANAPPEEDDGEEAEEEEDDGAVDMEDDEGDAEMRE